MSKLTRGSILCWLMYALLGPELGATSAQSAVPEVSVSGGISLSSESGFATPPPPSTPWQFTQPNLT